MLSHLHLLTTALSSVEMPPLLDSSAAHRERRTYTGKPLTDGARLPLVRTGVDIWSVHSSTHTNSDISSLPVVTNTQSSAAAGNGRLDLTKN